MCVYRNFWYLQKTKEWTTVTVKDMVSKLTLISTAQYNTFEDSTKISVEVTHQTTGRTLTSSSSHRAEFYFQCAALVVGVVGAAANGLVLYALVTSKQHKKHMLIFNQNVFDFVNCLCFAVVIPLELSNIYFSGMGGYCLCLMLLSYAGSWAANIGSLVNLAAISIERYLRVVHHVWAKNKLRNWMIYLAITFAWTSGIVIAAAITVKTTTVVNGVCYTGVFLLSDTAHKIYEIYDFLSFYVIILLIFIFCYGRILVVIRQQAHVMAAHCGQGSNVAQDQSNKIQTSVIKTMILVCVLFAITLAPANIYMLMINFHELMIDQNVLYVVLSIAYIYIIANPFIYATKFDPVKRVLLGLILCKKNNMQAHESGGNT